LLDYHRCAQLTTGSQSLLATRGCTNPHATIKVAPFRV